MPPDPHPDPVPACRAAPASRRAVLRATALLAAAAATGCSAGGAGTPQRRAAPPPAPVTPTPTPTPTPVVPSLPPVARWRPDAAEALAPVKQAAADLVQDLCTRARGEGLEAALARSAAPLAPGLDRAALLALAAPLGEGVASTGAVVYPQWGGLDPNGEGARTAAVMVVVLQRRLSAAGAVSAQTRTVDVRLTRTDAGWQVTSVESVGGEEVARGPLPDRVVHLLDSPLVSLPDSARWDLHAGRVSADLVDLLLSATALGPLSLTCLRNGHPHHVFGTGRASDHSQGQAADLWRVGGVPVVRAGATGPVAQLQRDALGDRRVAQVGSPPGSDVDGRGSRRSFANLVHADHLHLSVRR